MTVYNLLYLICIGIVALSSVTHIVDYIEKKIKKKHRPRSKD